MTESAGKLVVDEPVDGVVRLRISNPDKRGALDHEILDAITATVGEQSSRCLVLTGDGPVFSAGYDIGNFNDESAFSEAAEKLVNDRVIPTNELVSENENTSVPKKSSSTVAAPRSRSWRCPATGRCAPNSISRSPSHGHRTPSRPER